MHSIDPGHPDSTMRPAGSKAEARAAQWCAAQLSSYGYEVEVDEFLSRTSVAPWIAVDLSVAAIAGLLLGIVPLLSFALGAIALVLYARDVEGRAPLAARRITSSNVVATTPRAPRIVVFAGLDGFQGWSAWHGSLGRKLRSATLVVHFILIVIPAIAGAVWIFGAHSHVRVELLGALLAVVLIAASAWICTHDSLPEDLSKDIPVQTALRVGELHLPDVWIVLGGASGAGNEGIQALLHLRGEQIGSASILALEQVGKGPVMAIEQEGVLKLRRAHGALVQAAEDAGAEVADWRTTPTDGGVALARHFRAMTLLLGSGDEPDPESRMLAMVRSIIIASRSA
ncbi:MAG: hypothetical protein ABR579_00720 [Actinomycetota bacterium]